LNLNAKNTINYDLSKTLFGEKDLMEILQNGYEELGANAT